jgi:hypothetical protein
LKDTDSLEESVRLGETLCLKQEGNNKKSPVEGLNDSEVLTKIFVRSAKLNVKKSVKGFSIMKSP